MEDIKNKNAYRILAHESIKAFLIMFIVLIFIGWFINNTIDIADSALFALLITAGVMIPLAIALKIMSPSISKKSREDRINAFKEHSMAKKLTATITIFLSLFFIIIWLIIKVENPPFQNFSSE